MISQTVDDDVYGINSDCDYDNSSCSSISKSNKNNYETPTTATTDNYIDDNNATVAGGAGGDNDAVAPGNNISLRWYIPG